jgi:hypothetical protein
MLSMNGKTIPPNSGGNLEALRLLQDDQRMDIRSYESRLNELQPSVDRLAQLYADVIALDEFKKWRNELQALVPSSYPIPAMPPPEAETMSEMLKKLFSQLE